MEGVLHEHSFCSPAGRMRDRNESLRGEPDICIIISRLDEAEERTEQVRDEGEFDPQESLPNMRWVGSTEGHKHAEWLL
jgi:hypothetical protein